jgi:hypothetical protein
MGTGALAFVTIQAHDDRRLPATTANSPVSPDYGE